MQNLIRFRTPEQLQGYLKAGKAEISFRAYPIAENRKTTVTTAGNGSYQGKRRFDSLDDFICYAFQWMLRVTQHGIRGLRGLKLMRFVCAPKYTQVPIFIIT